jgi:peptidoglycan/xylan/chitin deacetylase (PgdA/CDA1 family)
VKRNPVKRIIKRSLQHVAASFGHHTRSSKEPELLILMYHRILPADDPRALREEPGMMVTPDTFKLHLELVKQYFTIVDLSDWIELKNSGKSLPDKACAITFDDGWADNYQFAFPILQELQVPATIFLVADMIGTTQNFWPERLAIIMTAIATRFPQHWSHAELAWLQPDGQYQFNEVPPGSEEVSALIGTLKAYSDQEMHERLTHVEKVLQLDVSGDDVNDSPVSLLDWQQVDEMLASGLIKIGSHTCNHIRLNDSTPSEQLHDEIVNSKQVIEKHIGEKNIGETAATFCYPNGDHCPEAVALVEQNYTAAVTTKSGWNTQQSNMHLLQRVGIHQDAAADKTAFLARISKWI